MMMDLIMMSRQLHVIVILNGKDLTTYNPFDMVIVQLSMVIKFTLLEELGQQSKFSGNPKNLSALIF